MLKYTKIINEETKQCEVGLGTNTTFYQSIGMVEMDVEQAYDGNWYLSGYAPQKPEELLAQEKRKERDALLESTDKYLISDYPISDEQREEYKEYRQYLRDVPLLINFPNFKILTFEEYTTKGN